MPISERFTQKYKRLVEYKVHDLNETKPLYANDIETGFIKEEDPVKDNAEEQPVDQTPGTEVPSVEPEPTIEEPKETPDVDSSKIEQKTEILKNIAQNHTDKIDAMLHYLETISQEVDVLKQKELDMEILKGHVGQLEKQVEFLTPPTPEESLQKMVRISGGQTIDDYWKEYLAKQGKTMTGSLPYYANGNLSSEPAQIQNIKYSDDEIKKSLGL